VASRSAAEAQATEARNIHAVDPAPDLEAVTEVATVRAVDPEDVHVAAPGAVIVRIAGK
jgi:hypothetical protein